MSTSSRSDGDAGEARAPQDEARPAKKVLIGRVSSAHGVQGEISVVPLTDFPERFQSMRSISLYRGGRLLHEVELRGVRMGPKGTLILRTDMEDRASAEACAGAEILIDPEERVSLPPGRFWVDDLIGSEVQDMEGRPLGTVTDIIPGANELYEVRDPSGSLHYVPAVEEIVREIELARGRIRVALIEGLWEL
ncbi:MAG: 16S rRNA processing protein RimM [Synergistaceae bacterium]|nr:16S rRNA processing protein RimM [Synergistaceae bacterium]